MDIRKKADMWLRENAMIYRGNNASDCMIAAFVAGAAAAIEDDDEDERITEGIQHKVSDLRTTRYSKVEKLKRCIEDMLEWDYAHLINSCAAGKEFC